MHWLVMMVLMMMILMMMRMMVMMMMMVMVMVIFPPPALRCFPALPVVASFLSLSPSKGRQTEIIGNICTCLLASKISKVTFSFYLVRYQLEANLLPPTSLPAPHCLASISASGRQSGVARQREKYVRATAHRPCCLRLGEGLG